jgi:hypothetical protein
MTDTTPHSRDTGEGLEVKDYIHRFERITSLFIKRNIIKELLKDYPRLKINQTIKNIKNLTDKIHFLDFSVQEKGKLSFFENLTLSSLRASLESRIKKRVNSLFKEITTVNRKGKKFEGILMGSLSPLIKENDSAVIEALFQKLASLPDTSPLSKLYQPYIRQLSSCHRIIQNIRDTGITEDNIEKTINKYELEIVKPGMRTLILNLFFLDNRFAPFKKLIQDSLSRLERPQEEKADYQQGILSPELDSMMELKNAEQFAARADELLKKNSRYLDELAYIFDIVLNRPLVNIYKILKFPIDRKLFKNWIEKAPLPAKMSGQTASQLSEINNMHTGQEKQDIKTRDDLIKLIYNMKICFTNKYNFLSELPKDTFNTPIVNYCLNDIQNVQFTIENKSLNYLLNQLNNCFSLSDIELVFKDDMEKIKARLTKYKNYLNKNVHELFKYKLKEINAVLNQIKKEIKEERFINVQDLISLQGIMDNPKDLMPVTKLANFLTGFYLILNAREILKFLKRFFKNIIKSDGLFLKNKLSSLTKEDIHDFCIKYTREPEFLKKTLNKYLKWGEQEKHLRESTLRSFQDKTTGPGITVQKSKVSLLKYGNNYVLKIITREKGREFSREFSNVNNFLDFLNLVKKNKIENLLPVSIEQLKLLYQASFIDYIKNLSDYIVKKSKLLDIPFSSYVIKEVKSGYERAPDKAGYIKQLREEGENEKNIRASCLDELQSENRIKELKNDEIQKRIQSEIGEQKKRLERIDKLMKFIGTLQEVSKNKPLKKVSTISKKEIISYFQDHRVRENNQYIEGLKEKAAELPGEDNTGNLTGSLEKGEILELKNPVILEDTDLQKLQDAMDSAVVSSSLYEAAEYLQKLLEKTQIEKDARREYISSRTAGSEWEKSMYLKENEYQNRAIKTLGKFIPYIQSEMEKLKRVSELNNLVQTKIQNLSKQIKGKTEEEAVKIFSENLSKLEKEEEKTETAANFMIKTDIEGIIIQAKKIIQDSPVNKYKMLLALYEILDRQPDKELKLKILNDFCGYLSKEHHKIYLEIKYLLDVQRAKITNEKKNHEKHITKIWENLNALGSNEQKIDYLKSLLQDPDWKPYYININTILEGLLTDNIREFITRQNHLPVSDQKTLIRLFKTFRAPEYNTPEINHALRLKGIELETKSNLYTGKQYILKKRELESIKNPRKTIDELVNIVDDYLVKSNKKVVYQALIQGNIPEEQANEYIKENISSLFPSEEKENSKRSNESRKEIPEKKKLKENKMIREINKEEVKNQGLEKKARGGTQKLRPVKPTTKKIMYVETLADARSLVGASKIPEEKNMVKEVVDFVKENDIGEALKVLQEKIYWECARSQDYIKLTRIINSLSREIAVQHNREITERIEQYLNSMEPVIVKKAKEKFNTLKAELKTDHIEIVMDEEDIRYEQQQKEENENPLLAIKKIIENIPTFTNPFSLARDRGLGKEEEKKISEIILTSIKAGECIYLPDHKVILGSGHLKRLIDKAHREMSAKQHVTVNISMLKSAWDMIRRFPNAAKQFYMIGISSNNERSELNQKLQELLRPDLAIRSRERIIHRPINRAVSNIITKIEKTPKKPEKKKPVTVKKKEKKVVPAAPAAKKPVKEKKHHELKTTRKKLVHSSYAPIINDYLKKIYKSQEQFVINIKGSKRYFSKKMIGSIIIQILRSDSKGKSHMGMLDSVKKDKHLMEMLISELFIEKKGKDGTVYYFPRCLKIK